ncbi:sigma-70 family RNA polymerase sigma factor [Jannaschia seohaensis]|uniref:RNA polymerase sigma-70 factor (ECF subfamily) n=1 Tax=Jannaschia seohaensis TaxID=475081 RepID=A0A2Y9C749_9RHOB|nr:sigma-70 family RNA polymerase sigma factor [Jannaschia seohaensis]PWJ20317.1 RNA polymerase sigma-70 factor (ECF subfamily) [Jannaschia seohaensis]SSA44353.1 RNA polymerase sigma-70 factor, ECF subfamily [Jannaschia seohaensis]
MARDTLDIVGQLDALRRYALVLTRDAEAADDLVQATFVRAQERRASFRDGADPRVWLMAILHNLFIDGHRSARAAQARERAWAESRPPFVAPSGENAARLAQLRVAFLSLSAEQREALHLVALEGLGPVEAAQVLDVPPGTVMSRVGRARAALRAFEDGGAETKPARPFRIVGGHNARQN